MKHKFSSLPVRLRLTLTFTALLLALLLALGFSLYFVVSQTLNGRLETELRNETERLVGAEAHYPDAALVLPGRLRHPDNNNPLNNPDGSPQIQTELKFDQDRLPGNLGLYRPDGPALVGPTGVSLPQPALLEAVRAAHNLPQGQGQFRQLTIPDPDTPGGTQQRLAYVRPVYAPADPANEQSPLSLLAIAVNSAPYTETATLLETMGRVLLVSLPVAVLLSLLLGSFVAGRALQPIKAITETARQISATDLNRRIGLAGQDELGQLARTFDQMIERLQSSFSRQRRFVADASHELRTPLAVIEAEATLMLKRPREAEDYRRSLELIADEANRMKALIEDMLTLARTDSAEFELRPRPVALDDLVAEAVARISRLAGQKNQRVQLDSAEEIWMTGDAEALTGLFFNLLSNAVKYTQPGGRIEVTLRRNGADEALFRVADNGPGISPEHLPYLFDRFYRADRARTRAGSSGLGLAIAQWAAHAHGGRIEVRSQAGQGATFEVLLPLNHFKLN